MHISGKSNIVLLDNGSWVRCTWSCDASLNVRANQYKYWARILKSRMAVFIRIFCIEISRWRFWRSILSDLVLLLRGTWGVRPVSSVDDMIFQWTISWSTCVVSVDSLSSVLDTTTLVGTVNALTLSIFNMISFCCLRCRLRTFESHWSAISISVGGSPISLLYSLTNASDIVATLWRLPSKEEELEQIIKLLCDFISKILIWGSISSIKKYRKYFTGSKLFSLVGFASEEEAALSILGFEFKKGSPSTPFAVLIWLLGVVNKKSEESPDVRPDFLLLNGVRVSENGVFVGTSSLIDPRLSVPDFLLLNGVRVSENGVFVWIASLIDPRFEPDFLRL